MSFDDLPDVGPVKLPPGVLRCISFAHEIGFACPSRYQFTCPRSRHVPRSHSRAFRRRFHTASRRSNGVAHFVAGAFAAWCQDPGLLRQGSVRGGSALRTRREPVVRTQTERLAYGCVVVPVGAPPEQHDTGKQDHGAHTGRMPQKMAAAGSEILHDERERHVEDIDGIRDCPRKSEEWQQARGKLHPACRPEYCGERGERDQQVDRGMMERRPRHDEQTDQQLGHDDRQKRSASVSGTVNG